MLGTFRDPNWPHAHIHAADFASPLHSAAEIEIVVGITDRADTPIAGYGWMFPTGRGTVSVGVVLMSTSPSFQVINPAQLHEQFVATQRDRWQLDGPPICPPIGGRVPMGSSVGPLAGPTWVTIGDAAGAANPLTAMGIETALETGIMAGEVVADALDQDSAAVLQQYPKLLAERYGSYYKIGRLTDRLLGRPAAARRIHAAMSSRPALADGALRIATQHLRGGRGGGVETLYRLARAVSIIAPDA
jgi:flavin-dependent dehydrogenase